MEITWQCELSEGIHARPAGHIARLCNAFQADIRWHNRRSGLDGSAKSALSLVATDTLPGDNCRITLEGPDAPAAAAQLIELLKNLPVFAAVLEPASGPMTGVLPRCLQELHPDYLQGTRVSAGIAIARPVVMQGLTFDELMARNPGDLDTPDNEKRRLSEGLNALRMELEAALGTTHGIARDLTEAHLAYITDRAFWDAMVDHIDNRMNGWSAIISAARDFSAVFERSASHYIQERTLDILDIATQLLSALYGAPSLMQPHLALTQPSLLFATTLTPSQFIAIDKQHLAGLVLASTGKTSHTAILARSMGIPTLADIDFSAIDFTAPRDMVLDGEPGILIADAGEKVLRYYRHETQVLRQTRQPLTDRALITPDVIQWGLDAQDKNEVIKKMVDNLWLLQRTDSREALCQDIWAREVPFPTVVGSGFAIPHAQTDAINASTISVAALSQPVAWGDVQVDTVFMLTISRSAARNEHMKYFSTLARLLMDDEFVAQIQKTATPAALYQLIFNALAL
ncbi:PTS sugar transporter subunit IIA [Atlantibacter sp.]|uniref:PTS sugar transporter subunit IIA n=1 Tax=Atlantibacter sp. TaxID=1903473 RepID=UPI0028AD9134|nr:PTS sugar transporter subunit IIA [Atlantibacter sp.]